MGPVFPDVCSMMHEVLPIVAHLHPLLGLRHRLPTCA